jgi:hypothetical protein
MDQKLSKVKDSYFATASNNLAEPKLHATTQRFGPTRFQQVHNPLTQRLCHGVT